MGSQRTEASPGGVPGVEGARLRRSPVTTGRGATGKLYERKVRDQYWQGRARVI